MVPVGWVHGPRWEDLNAGCLVRLPANGGTGYHLAPRRRVPGSIEQGCSHGEASADRFSDRKATGRTRVVTATPERASGIGQAGAGDCAVGRRLDRLGNRSHGTDATPPSVQVDRSLPPARSRRALGWQTHRPTAGLFPPRWRFTWSRSPANGPMRWGVRCRTGTVRSWRDN